ncbi:MAG: hypothetical protein LBV12_05745 [Puniceicoccales bacterium]|jgi:hypothetical protein|nr:hypothetical protein [Puniceicoccales bacterium]
MKIISAFLMMVLTLILLQLLNLGCEAYFDHYCHSGFHPPRIMVFIDGISPIGITYVLLPLLVGFISWYSPPINASAIIPTIVLLACLLLLMGVMWNEQIMNGYREVTVSRYFLNADMVGIGVWLCYHVRKTAKATEKDAKQKNEDGGASVA